MKRKRLAVIPARSGSKGLKDKNIKLLQGIPLVGYTIKAALDSGIFEYLLGELSGILSQEAQGQLIFASHNLRVPEKLDHANIICSTTNARNRYIRLQGIEKK